MFFFLKKLCVVNEFVLRADGNCQRSDSDVMSDRRSSDKTEPTQFIIFAVGFVHTTHDIQKSQRKAFFAVSER